LRSTRSEVEKILGKPTGSNHIYKIAAGTVDVTYSQQPCQQIGSAWGDWNVPANTVLTLSFDADFPVSDLKVRNLEKFKVRSDDAGTTLYRLPVDGIQYSVSGSRVVKITYGPTQSDKRLLCSKTRS
jgi:hypothetical protein